MYGQKQKSKTREMQTESHVSNHKVRGMDTETEIEKMRTKIIGYQDKLLERKGRKVRAKKYKEGIGDKRIE